MKQLTKTEENENLVQGFLTETRKRISEGVEIRFSNKALDELQDLQLLEDIDEDDIEHTILNLSLENYYRGIDPSKENDFKVCAFKAQTGTNKIDIYLKYGLQNDGLEILIFSNHIPDYPMDQPFKN